MTIKRVIGFALLLYVATFLVYGVVQLVPNAAFPSLLGYGIFWVLNIPIVLILAKWYFKRIAPSPKRGLQLGVFAIVVAFILDGLFWGLALAGGQGASEFSQMYSDWKFYLTILEVIALCTYAGYEFDKTYSGKR